MSLPILQDCPHRWYDAAAPNHFRCRVVDAHAPADRRVVIADQNSPGCLCFSCQPTWDAKQPPSIDWPPLGLRPFLTQVQLSYGMISPEEAEARLIQATAQLERLGNVTANETGPAEAKPDQKKIRLVCTLPPGDVVTMTAAVRELKQRYGDQYAVAVETSTPELWENNPYLTSLGDQDPEVERIQMHYSESPIVGIHWSNQRPFHFIEGYCQHLAERLGLPELRPRAFHGDIHLSKEELETSLAEEFFGEKIPYWLICPGGKSDFTTKIWPTEYYQEVVDRLKDRIAFIQVGRLEDNHPDLDDVLDVRGTTHRQLIRLVHRSSGVLCGVSYLMHLAAAVPRSIDTVGLRPCVVIAGGREATHWEAYPGHQHLHTIGALSCCATGGCWKSRVVPLNDGKDDSLCMRPIEGPNGVYPECMRMITPDEVVHAVEKHLPAAKRRSVFQFTPPPPPPEVLPVKKAKRKSRSKKPGSHRWRVGVVIGSFNMPSVVRLNVAAIRAHCGAGVPILICDDASDGIGPAVDPRSPFGQLAELAANDPKVSLWPNPERVGHAGGDISAIWKGLTWAKSLGLDVLVKLSQRYIIDVPRWHELLCDELKASGLATIGHDCQSHGWAIRTECFGMLVNRWTCPEIMAHLTPRRISWPVEQFVFDDVRDRLDGKIHQWSLMSKGRGVRAPGMLFREANAIEDYVDLAARLNVQLGLDMHTTSSEYAPNYLMG